MGLFAKGPLQKWQPGRIAAFSSLAESRGAASSVQVPPRTAGCESEASSCLNPSVSMATEFIIDEERLWGESCQSLVRQRNRWRDRTTRFLKEQRSAWRGALHLAHKPLLSKIAPQPKGGKWNCAVLPSTSLVQYLATGSSHSDRFQNR